LAGEDFIKTVMIPGDKQLEYIVHLNNRDFISSFPKVLIPKHRDKNVRAFELRSDDMHDNFHGLNLGDLVFGKRINPPYKFGNGNLYTIITREKVIIRRVKTRKDHLELVPDNSNFSVISILKSEVLEAWEVIGYFSQKIDAPTLISERIMHLENQFDTLNERLSKLEKSI
jgi:hypothetical protein